MYRALFAAWFVWFGCASGSAQECQQQALNQEGFVQNSVFGGTGAL